MDPTIIATEDFKLEPSQLAPDALFNQLRDWFLADAEHSTDWRKQARQEFDFVAGHQWDPADRRTLEDQGRPVITFNRCLTVIKAVAGMEINGRQDIIFIPRNMQPGVVKANEILTGASQWMSDDSDAEDEQSDAFQDASICGMGWVEPRITYDEEPDGRYIEARINPLEMFWDRSATSKNLIDARRLFRVRKMCLAEARDMFPDIPVTELNATWAVSLGGQDELPKPVEDRRKREENSSHFDPKAEVHIVHAQWIEREPYVRVADPLTGKMLELSVDDFEDYKARIEQLSATTGQQLAFTFVEQYRKVFKQAFLGASILGEVMPGPCKDHFSWQCITGERDNNKGTFFGLTRLMADPQRWANKWLSQTLHILNSTAKGGIVAEADAFKDMREAQDTWAQPDAITWAAKGAISGQKIMAKPGQGLPQGYINLLEFAISSIRDASGVNLELLGLRDANQAGILEAQRKQAGMTILATLFDSLRRFRKNIGRVRLYFIQEYFSDGRLIRVTGDDGVMRMIPLLKDSTLGDYEVIVSDAPTSPNQKEQTWNIIMQILPVFKNMLTPEVVLAILEYSPLPSKVVEQFKSMASKPNPEAEMQKQIGMQNAQADIQKKLASAEKDRASAQAQLSEAERDMAEAKQRNVLADLQNVVARQASPTPFA